MAFALFTPLVTGSHAPIACGSGSAGLTWDSVSPAAAGEAGAALGEAASAFPPDSVPHPAARTAASTSDMPALRTRHLLTKIDEG
ncbi:hypothetical protein [Actinomadura chokoriensis]|uniref:hypothetical protein n=1 Tax=Actinomadura chokoriensis TaxID=454156 RepID=UPI0031F74F4C